MVAAFFSDPVKLAAARARYLAKMHPPAPKPIVAREAKPVPVKRDYIHVSSEPLAPTASIKQLITEVAKAYGVSYAEVIGSRRHSYIIAARFAAYHAVATARPDFSLPQIARHFGNRDHTTILHGLRKVRREGVPLPASRPANKSKGVA